MNKIINKHTLYFIIVIIFLSVYLLVNKNENITASETQIDDYIEEKQVITDKRVLLEIKNGSTFGSLMEGAGVEGVLAMDIYNAAKPLCDLAQIRQGRAIELIFDKDTEELKELIYNVDSEKKLCVRKYIEDNVNGASSTIEKKETWEAQIAPIEYEVRIRGSEGEVKTSMYEAALENNIDERAIIELANAFQWTIDFAMDPRVGDKFKFVYEERYLDGEYIMPGKILAGKYINDGVSFDVYYFEESEGNKGYFDKEGNSVQKMFLKAPVSFKYISSGFTTGRRYVEAFNVSTGHRAVDYAASLGSPIRAVGDGSVVSAGWNSQGYGNLIQIRHNSTYSTNYAHLSKFAVKRGQRVEQGQIIGYVGSTGFSTGPHLHYEMLKNGIKVNPLREVLPPGEPIKEENRDRFFSEIENYNKMLDTQ